MQRNTIVLIIKLSFAGPINTSKCFLGCVPVLSHLSFWCKVVRLWMGNNNNQHFSALELALLNMEMSEGDAESWCISVNFVVVTRSWKFFFLQNYFTFDQRVQHGDVQALSQQTLYDGKDGVDISEKNQLHNVWVCLHEKLVIYSHQNV